MTRQLSDGQTLEWLIDVQAVAEMLDISTRTVYRLAADGEIPHVRVGGQYRFEPEQVRRALDSQSTNR